jgi:ribosome-binding factor A
MPSKIRMERIADRIREDISEMLIQKINDPRVSGISITDVTVDRELAYADIYVSAVEGQERSAEILQGLTSASGFIRRELSQTIELRTFPRLRFHWDPTPERADHIERLLSQLHQETKPSEETKKND